MVDGDAYKFDTSLVSSKSGELGEVLGSLRGVLLMATEVSTQADLYEDERAVLPVEGVDVGVGVGWRSSCVDDVGGGSCSCRHHVVEVFLREGPCRNIPGGRRTFFVMNRCCPLWDEGLRVYGHVDSAISLWVRGGGKGVIKPVDVEWLLFFVVVVSGIRGLVMMGK